MAASSEDESLITVNADDDDLYTFLNVSREATNEELNNAYRRVSRLYHPDKHRDPVRKRQAELWFNKIKNAYEVLSDPHKRAIYDNLGTKGLETEGWEVVQRMKTPQEIREEYERLAKEREERRLQQRTNPKGTINVSINATELFDTYDDSYEVQKVLPQVEIRGMSISQSIEAPLTVKDTLTLSGQLHTQNGTGGGSVNCSWRRIFTAKSWTECDIGAGNGLLFTLRGFRTLSKRSFCNAAGIFHFTPHGIRPGLSATIARQLDKHTVGYLNWKAGINSSMETMVVWDTATGHFVFSIQLGMPTCFIALSYTRKFEDKGKVKGTLKVGTFGALVEYGCEKRISKHSIIGATMVVGIPIGVTLRIRINRGSQNYVFPIMLSEQLLPSAVFYGTTIPLILFYTVKVLIVNPYLKKEKQKETEKQKEATAAKVLEKRKEAESAVSLMQETYSRIRDQEEAQKGLVIVVALYGKVVTEEDRSGSEVVDVTIALQCLIKDSNLVLQDTKKHQLPGFYDPCVGEEKYLYVRYKFHNLLHEATFADNEMIRIPKQSHKIET